MADIQFNFKAKDLEQIQKILDQMVAATAQIKANIGSPQSKEAAKEMAAEAKRARVELDKQSKILESQKGIIGGLQAEIKKWKNEMVKATDPAGIKRAQEEINRLNGKLIQAKGSTNSWGKALDSFQFKFNALGNIAANIFGAMTRMAKQAAREAIKTVMNFEQAVADLNAIAAPTTKELKSLTDQAKFLGATTRFTASQVVSLQIELGKLGFIAADIQQATPAILDFAAATGAELAEAAKTAGVAVRAYGLSTAETANAVSTLAVATVKSALAFADFDTILSTVGPVAKSFGFTLEDTITLVAKLRDAGFDASKAATATRNIFLNLADSSGVLAKTLGRTPKTLEDLVNGLGELSDRGVDLNETLQMTDKRSVSAFNQFITARGTFMDFKESITSVNDEMQVMVEKRLDTMTGSVLILKSAWEGFLLTLEDGDGTIGKLVRGSLRLLSDALTEISNLDLISTRSSKLTEEQWTRTFDVLMSFSRNKQGKIFQDIIEGFDKVNVGLLKFDKQYKTSFLTDMFKEGFSPIEAWALWDVYVAKRQQQLDTENEAIEAYQQRKTETEDNARKLKSRKDKEVTDAEFKAILDRIKTEGDLTAEADKEWEDLEWARIERDAKIKKDALDQHAKDVENNQKDITAIVDAGAKERAENTKKTDAELEAAEQLKAQKKQAIIQATANLAFALSDLMLAKNTSAMNAELIAAEGNEKKQDEIRKKYAKKEQAISISQAIIAGAESVANVWSKWAYAPPIAAALTALSLATVGVQIATIKAQKFAKGGEIDYGRLHSEGGTLIEAEKGEYVINRKSTSKYKGLIEGINQDDQMKILASLHMDRRVEGGFKQDEYTKKLYELMKDKEVGYETPEFFVIHKGTKTIKLKKH